MKFDTTKIDKAMDIVKDMSLEELEFIGKYIYEYIKHRVKYSNK